LTKRAEVFEEDDEVDVVKPLYGDLCSFVGKSGKVVGFDGKWVLVVIEGAADQSPVGFREHELAKTDKDNVEA
jgi:hypothetical protein